MTLPSRLSTSALSSHKMETNNVVNLAWKEFEQCAGLAFKELFDDSDMTDVTLACADNIQIKAHKLILCASSPFFKGVLSKNPHSHPLLYLKGISGKTMESILSFVYQGEAKVLEADIKAFLDTADEFKIKGLCDMNIPPPAPGTKGLQSSRPVVKTENPIYAQFQQSLENQVQVGEGAWSAAESQAFDEFQGINSYQMPQYELGQKQKCDRCSYEATTVADLSVHTKHYHAAQSLQPHMTKPKLPVKKETVKCNICQMVLVNDRKNLLEHCRVYHNA